MEPRFIQIHTLIAYPGALLNRDDAGFAKRLPVGGTSRIRVSSQCLKRHWRTHSGERSLGEIEELGGSVRSRLTFERLIVAPLCEEGHSEAVVRQVVRKLMEIALGQSPKAKKAKGETAEPALKTGQITVLGRAEIEFLKSEAREACKVAPSDAKQAVKDLEVRLKGGGKKNLAALGKAASGLDAALFGRMVTSDLLARGDAAVHVAHAFTVHAEETETDYFSAVDDLLGAAAEDDESLGAGHIGTAELTSGLFYGYVVVDVPTLVSNIEGCTSRDWLSADRQLAGRVIEQLVHLIATVSPGAKLGSTAPHAYAHLVLLEAGSAQPRTFANAFLRATSPRPDLLANSYDDLGSHIHELDEMYGVRTERRLAGIGPVKPLCDAAGVERPIPLDATAEWARHLVESAG